jgi:hypothetical protein
MVDFRFQLVAAIPPMTQLFADDDEHGDLAGSSILVGDF